MDKLLSNSGGDSRRYYSLFAALAIIYLSLSLAILPDQAILVRYNINSSTARGLQLTIALPLIAVWFIACFGFIRFRHYAKVLGAWREGRALNILAKGLYLLALSLPVTAVVNGLLRSLDRVWPGLAGATVILNNYATLGFYAASFYWLHKGAGRLLALLSSRPSQRNERLFVSLFLITGLIFATMLLWFLPANGAASVYHLNDKTLVLTILIPYLVTWYWGLRAAYLIFNYARLAPGVIYRNIFTRLAAGIVIAVLAVIVSSLIAALSQGYTTGTLSSLLVAIYLLVSGIALGYVLIASAARHLQKIEEV